MTLQPADLDRLEQLAREATPGPWDTRPSLSRDPMQAGDVGLVATTLPNGPDYLPLLGEVFAERRRGKPDHAQAAADATYIAALSPAVVSELVAAARLGVKDQGAAYELGYERGRHEAVVALRRRP